ncbi:MAG: hypothetical protein LUI87_14085 [Lachnospiraceae bacterium]|nr:hypothetical protein [Lachnospiraceae bacterium]
MTLNESIIFIEEMEEIGDIWTQEQAIRVYEHQSLQEALNDRRSSLAEFANIIERVLN